MGKLIFLLSTWLVLNSSVLASVIHDKPECTFDVVILSQQKVLTGSLQLSNNYGSRPDSFCTQFEGKQVTISGVSRYSKLMLERLDSLEIGVQQFSSMGERGPVQGLHWEALKIIEGGKIVSMDEMPLFDIQLHR